MGVLKTILILLTVALIVIGVVENDNSKDSAFAILLFLLYLIYLVLS